MEKIVADDRAVRDKLSHPNRISFCPHAGMEISCEFCDGYVVDDSRGADVVIRCRAIGAAAHS